MQVERTNSNELSVNRAPYGSMVRTASIRKSETVFALNTTAGAAWDACSHPTRSRQSDRRNRCGARLMPGSLRNSRWRRFFSCTAQKLIATSGSSPTAMRPANSVMMSKIALPLVVSLTIAEQLA